MSYLLAPHGAQAIIVFRDHSLSLYYYIFQIFSSNLSNPSSRGGIVSDLCRSKSLGTSHSTQGRDDSSSTEGVLHGRETTVPRDLSLYTGTRWLLLHWRSNTVYCTILSVERCSLGNTSLHRDEMTPPPLKEYSSVLSSGGGVRSKHSSSSLSCHKMITSGWILEFRVSKRLSWSVLSDLAI